MNINMSYARCLTCVITFDPHYKPRDRHFNLYSIAQETQGQRSSITFSRAHSFQLPEEQELNSSLLTIAHLKCFLQCSLYHLIIFSISMVKTNSLFLPLSYFSSSKKYPLTPILLSLTLAYTYMHNTHTQTYTNLGQKGKIQYLENQISSLTPSISSDKSQISAFSLVNTLVPYGPISV